MQKKSLLLIDGDKLKIVYGEKMRCIGFPDLRLEHNAEFLEKIFRTTTVFKVDQVSPVDREQLEGLLTADDSAPAPTSTKAVVPEVARQTSSVDQSSNWIVSNSKTTIIIDDLFTGSMINRGRVSVPQSVVLPPGKPFDLGSIDDSLVKASKILPRQLSKGTVSRISLDEAMEMLDSYNKGQENVVSVLDGQSKGVTAATGIKATELVDSMFAEDTPSVIPVEVSLQEKRATSFSNEDSGSMENLMEMLSSAEEGGELKGVNYPRLKPWA